VICAATALWRRVEQLRQLQEIGCAFAQGFFMGEPVVAESVDGLLEAAPEPDPACATAPIAVRPAPRTATRGAEDQVEAQAAPGMPGQVHPPN
jgi:hypothetical protein